MAISSDLNTRYYIHNTDKFVELWRSSHVPAAAAQMSTHFPWNKTFPIMQHTGASTTREYLASFEY